MQHNCPEKKEKEKEKRILFSFNWFLKKSPFSFLTWITKHVSSGFREMKGYSVSVSTHKFLLKWTKQHGISEFRREVSPLCGVMCLCTLMRTKATLGIKFASLRLHLHNVVVGASLSLPIPKFPITFINITAIQRQLFTNPWSVHTTLVRNRLCNIHLFIVICSVEWSRKITLFLS